MRSEREKTVIDLSGKALNEVELNFLGKVLFASMGAWLVGKLTNIKIRGSQDEVQAIVNAMLSSKRFQEELRKPGASVQSVIDKLNLKNVSASEFKRVLGIEFPL